MAGIMHRVHLRGGGMDMGNQTSQDKSANMGGDYGGQGNNNQKSGSDPNKYNANREVVKAAQEAAAAQQTPTKTGAGILDTIKNFNFGDFFNKAYTNAGQFFGATSPTLQTGLLAANIANFNPQFDEEGNTVKSSIFGDLGTGLFGSYNPNNPAYGFTDEQKQSFMNSLYDPDETKGYSVNELAAKEYAESIAPGIFDSLSLEKTPQEMEQDRIDAQGGSNKEPVVQELVTMDANSIEKNNIIKEYIAKGYPPDMAEYLYEALHANA